MPKLKVRLWRAILLVLIIRGLHARGASLTLLHSVSFAMT